MSNCIFCQILSKEIPSYTVYENEHVYAFLDITQVSKGHTLIIPKPHVKDVFEWTPDIASSMGEAIEKVSKALKKAFPNMQGLNIINNNGERAYQSVFHSHIHLIPRFPEQDGLSITFEPHSPMYTQEEMHAIAQTITQAF
ncbi:MULTISPECIES: HIT family protein [unclassified Granulicatella]|uniref:HIT family protein n=1 Tax=unclassified Granulicatella TaxID=2630493 RepID=UPI0010732EB7|nr:MULTISPECIES: HIT family protein [unclassified Granulicatella]MBF0780860.1 HIT family protein [Granulicatella sp. 19428wC4_WM01]TFU93498.1 HIT family protein [Granulicatella sp. WM01]